jgi:hypothetical protein
MSEKENFIQAVEDDEYAEYELSCGAVLITDWEGDGVFNPYVVIYDIDDDVTDLDRVIGDQIAEAFNVRVTHIETDYDGDVCYPLMERPTA